MCTVTHAPFGLLGVSLRRINSDIEMKYRVILNYNNFLFPWEEIPGNSEADGKGKRDAAS